VKPFFPIALLTVLGGGALAGASVSGMIHPAMLAGPGKVANEPGALSPPPTCHGKSQGELSALDLSDMKLWNYHAKWHPSQWDNNFSYVPWRADHISQLPNGDVTFRLDGKGGAQLKSEAGTLAALRGLWEVEVTLPELRDGMVAAPLWLYNQKRQEEIDIEFAGRRSMDVSVHAYPDGTHHKQTIHLFRGTDFSHCTLKLGIKADVPAGWAEIYVDGKLAYRFTRQELGYFPTGALRPVSEIWSARDNHAGLVAWLGRWQPLPAGQSLVMTIHGYRYSPLP